MIQLAHSSSINGSIGNYNDIPVLCSFAAWQRQPEGAYLTSVGFKPLYCDQFWVVGTFANTVSVVRRGGNPSDGLIVAVADVTTVKELGVNVTGVLVANRPGRRVEIYDYSESKLVADLCVY